MCPKPKRPGPQAKAPGPTICWARTNGQSARIISVLGALLLDYPKATCPDMGATVDQTLVCTGDFADESIEVADDMGADLIVLGSRGLGALRGGCHGPRV